MGPQPEIRGAGQSVGKTIVRTAHVGENLSVLMLPCPKYGKDEAAGHVTHSTQDYV